MHTYLEWEETQAMYDTVIIRSIATAAVAVLLTWTLVGTPAAWAADDPMDGGAESVQTGRSEPPYRRFHVGSSAFMLLNLVPFDKPPRFGMLTFGVRLTPRDVLSFEAITWQYHEPLGVPYGQKEQPENAFPGPVRDVGLGVAYQRFLWKGAYAAAHATPFYQTYLDARGDRIQSGFQLFVAARVGYHLAFASNRLFIEPSVAFTAWPINTNLPEEHAALEAQFPSFLPIEPGMHLGVKF